MGYKSTSHPATPTAAQPPRTRKPHKPTESTNLPPPSLWQATPARLPPTPETTILENGERAAQAGPTQGHTIQSTVISRLNRPHPPPPPPAASSSPLGQVGYRCMCHAVDCGPDCGVQNPPVSRGAFAGIVPTLTLFLGPMLLRTVHTTVGGGRDRESGWGWAFTVSLPCRPKWGGG